MSATHGSWGDPILGGDGVIGGSAFAVRGTPYGSNSVYHMFIGNTTANAPKYYDNYSAPFFVLLYFPYPTRLSTLNIIGYYSVGITWSTCTISAGDNETASTALTNISKQSTTGLNTWDISASTVGQYHKYWKLSYSARMIAASMTFTSDYIIGTTTYSDHVTAQMLIKY